MTWQLQYTHPVSSQADYHTFFVYFFDTYLNNKSQFAVTAHPDASAFKRSFSMTYPNPFDGGNNFTTYWWVDWANTTAPTQLKWNIDVTYTSVPGDLGTHLSGQQVNQFDSNFTGSGASNIKIWQSSERADAMLVTYGKRVAFFWPGCTQLAIPQNALGVGPWDGSGGIIGQGWVMPFVGDDQSIRIYNPCYTYQVNYASKYTAVPSYGFQSGYFNSKFPDGPTIFTGASWDAGDASYQNSTYSHPVMDASTTDFGWYVNTPTVDTAGDDYYVLAVSSIDGSLIFDTNSSKYWFVTRSGQNSATYAAFDMGTSEPDFS
jgi:hypothetical protein